MSNQYPNNFQPLLTRLKEVLEDGKGSPSSTVIPLSQFNKDRSIVREGFEDNLGREVLSSAQIEYFISRKFNRNVIDAIWDFSIFMVEVTVKVYAQLPNITHKEGWGDYKAYFPLLAEDVVHALQNASNLQTTEAGDPTGLASGLLQHRETKNVRFDWENKVGSQEIMFEAPMFMNK